MKIFQSFLIILCVGILLMLPITTAIYYFRTYVKEDTSYAATDVGITSANITLIRKVYQDDPSTIKLSSDLPTDVPALVSYNLTNRVIEVTGLTPSKTRTLTIDYDVDALNLSPALADFTDHIGLIWMISVIAFAPAAIAAIFMNRA